VTYKNIALIGKARSGKDSIAQHLTRYWSFTRVAFADPLKEMALRIDPVVPNKMDEPDRLSRIVGDYGWERAKDLYPEVRRFLQSLGQSVRELDDRFWINQAAPKLATAAGWNLPVVVTDVRYVNEAIALRDAGFTLVRVVRPGSASTDMHVSENELDKFPVENLIVNDGTLFDLGCSVDLLVEYK
jgi:hypothetical protein